VQHFVLVYDQRLGRLVADVEVFGDSDAGMQRRFELERKFRDDPKIEVVMLSASSEEQIRRTHSRYFKTTAELLADLRG
jgi:hypothetical protein